MKLDVRSKEAIKQITPIKFYNTHHVVRISGSSDTWYWVLLTAFGVFMFNNDLQFVFSRQICLKGPAMAPKQRYTCN